MSAVASEAKRKGATANRHGHSDPFNPLHLQRENERLQRENADFRRKVAERDKRIADADKRIADSEKMRTGAEDKLAGAEKQIADAEEQIADLERKLAGRKKNSTNSSKPPSSDGLAGNQRPRGSKSKGEGKSETKAKRKRKPGGQSGHPGHHRKLFPPSAVDVFEVGLPSQCQHCCAKLPQDPAEVETKGDPRRHQVTEIPEIKPHVTEYQFPNVVCSACRHTTREPLPKEIAGDFGEQLAALIAYWTVICRIPRRPIEAMLSDVMKIDISLGSTQKAWEEVSQAVEQPCEELQRQLRREAVLNADETGWRTNGDKRWLWALVAQRFVVFVVANTRGKDVLVSLLGAVFNGTLCSGRWAVYLKYHSGSMQLCWAHLKRNILGIADYAQSERTRQFCRDALAIIAKLFRLWYRFRGDLRDKRGNPHPIDRRQLIEKSIPLQKKLFALAEAYLDDDDREVRNMATALFVNFDRLFTFLEVEGVEPTNNISERTLRIAVQWRKISFGNRSRRGEIATSRLLTVSQTCKLQERNVLEYLTAAVKCHRRGVAAPSLLPPQG